MREPSMLASCGGVGSGGEDVQDVLLVARTSETEPYVAATNAELPQAAGGLLECSVWNAFVVGKVNIVVNWWLVATKNHDAGTLRRYR